MEYNTKGFATTALDPSQLTNVKKQNSVSKKN